MKGANETEAGKAAGDGGGAAERWQKITDIFAAASELTGSERDKFLRASCDGDTGMFDEISRLLASFEDSGTFLESPAIADSAGIPDLSPAAVVDASDDGSGTGNFVAGTVLAGRYRIIGILGKGGMGEVYKAEDLKLGQSVALKFLPEGMQSDSAALERFHAEVRHARQVSHPNVCRVFDIGEVDGRHFISMEFIDGDDLSSLLRRVGRLSSERAVEISRQLCVGLSAIHNAGILHRDLKPANVIIDSRGKVRITDFGIAGIEDESARDRMRVGTPAYMSPEQIRGSEVSAKSDIYSLGLVLFEIFTGKQAFQADSVPELIKKHTEETPTNPSDFVKELDPLVERIIKRCLEKSPGDRPSSALQVALALPGGNPAQIALDAGETPSPEMVAATPKKGVLRPVTAVGLVLAGLVFMAVGYFVGIRIEPQHRIPFEKSDEVLSQQANAFIRKFGYTDKPADRWNAFLVNPDYRNYIWGAQTRENVEKFSSGQPMFFEFYELHSLSKGFQGNMYGYYLRGYTPHIPAERREIILDTRGRLTYFASSSPDFVENPTGRLEPDWSPAFSAAELDPAKFTEAEPKWFPPHAFDIQRAWEGVLPDHPEFPLRVEAAGFQGKIVFFRLIYPWTVPNVSTEKTEQASWTIRQWIGNVFFQAIEWGYLVVVVYLAYRNLKKGSADRKGAFKLGVTVFVALTISGLLMIGGSLSTELLFDTIEGTAFSGLQTYLLYAALEPIVRRRLPELIVSWNRALAGDWRDPLVGRDILIGTVFGCGFGQLVPFAVFLERYLIGNYRMMYNSPAFLGLKNSFILFFESLESGILAGGSAVLALTILYILLRRKAYAVSAYFLCLFVYFSLALPQGNTYIIHLPFLLIGAAGSAVLVSRFGLLTMITGNFVFLLSIAMVAADLSAWYAKPMILSTLTMLFLLGFGLKTSIADQRLFESRI